MSLSPFDSFQSRFVTYFLNFSRNIEAQLLNHFCHGKAISITSYILIDEIHNPVVLVI